MRSFLILTLLLTLAALPARAQDSLRIAEALSAFDDDFAGVVRVERGGEPVFKQAYGLANWELNVPNTADTRFKLHSLSKALTAAVVHRAADQGALELDRSVCAYLEPCPESWSRASVRHLLNHSSAIPDLTSDLLEVWTGELDESLSAAIERAGPSTQTGFPGGQFQYNNFGYVLLARILEIAYGQSFDEVMQTQLFDPAGMIGAGVESSPPPGGYDGPLAVKGLASGYNGSADAPQRALSKMYVIPGAGAIYANALDMTRFANALFEARLTTNKMLDSMVTPSISLDTAYAYGIVTTTSNGLLTHRHDGGNNGYVSWLAHYPDHDVTLVILSNQGFAPINDMRKAIEDALFRAEG